MKKFFHNIFFVLLFCALTFELSAKKNNNDIPLFLNNPSVDAPRPDLTLIGFIFYADGIGRILPELLDSFKDEMHINVTYTRKLDVNQIPIKLRSFIDENKKKRWGKVVLYTDWLKEFKYEVFDSCPEDSIRIAYSMWESTKIPDDWVYHLNTYFDAVAVPSPFLIQVYRNCGVNIPIFDVPHGIDLKLFLNEHIKENRNYPFVFGNLSSCHDRKNHLALIQAFAKAFPNNPSVFLKINGRAADKKLCKTLQAEIENLKLSNVSFTVDRLKTEDYIKEFKRIDCYVSPSKGEGFSLQPREAMILGIPVIATNNTGQRVICDSGLVKIVDSPFLETAVFPWGTAYGEHFNCDVDELARAMTEVKENYDFYLEKAKEARKWASQYTYENLKEIYRCLLKPKKVIFGKQNIVTKDYLMTNDSELYRKYSEFLNEVVVK